MSRQSFAPQVFAELEAVSQPRLSDHRDKQGCRGGERDEDATGRGKLPGQWSLPVLRGAHTSPTPGGASAIPRQFYGTPAAITEPTPLPR